MSDIIKIANFEEKGDWCNITTDDGRKISVMLTKCPKLKEQLKSAGIGTELTGKLVTKNDKIYLWDDEPRRSGGGKSAYVESPEKQALILAQSCMGYAITFYIGMPGIQSVMAEKYPKPSDAVTVLARKFMDNVKFNAEDYLKAHTNDTNTPSN